MDTSEEFQLIDGDGVFNASGIEKLIKEIKLSECGLSYAVVSIMGPQCSGKSTLLNHLFGTKFREMDAEDGRCQTTKGIWLARCKGIEPCTLVMDLEGTDGSERGEDDTAFEKQSALFALVVSDIVLMNMWCHDIGREQAANRPLLKTVFQVMMKLFSPRKTTLMFVIRDKTRTSPAKLEHMLREDIQKIWDSVPKPRAHQETLVEEFFNVEVVALCSYEEREEQFKEQVSYLRQRFFHSIAPGGLAGDCRGVVPASGFSFSAQQIWKVIKGNKDLDLPAHKVMVATVRCEEIANEKFVWFATNETWCQLEENIQSSPIAGLGKKLTSILGTCLSEYDMEATYFDQGASSTKRKYLEEKLLQLIQPVFQSQLGHIRSEVFDKFKAAFDKALDGGEEFSSASHNCSERYLNLFDQECADAVIEHANWDTSRVRNKLFHDINAHVASVRAAHVASTTYEVKLKEALSESVEALLDGANNKTWLAIRKLLKQETESAVSGLSSGLAGYDIDEQSKEKLLSDLANYARGIIETKVREEARRVLSRMQDRFLTLFCHDSDSLPRIWTAKEDIREIAKTARTASLELLSVMAAIRLDDIDADNIERTLFAALLSAQSSTGKNKSSVISDPLASCAWEQVPSSRTLITPIQCKSLWKQFNEETEYSISQAIDAQEAKAAEKARMRSDKMVTLASVCVTALTLGMRIAEIVKVGRK